MICGVNRKIFVTLHPEMCSLTNFDIDLKSLKDAETLFSYHLNDGFFEALDASELEKGDVEAEVVVRRTTDSLFELDFTVEGDVVVLCDRCLDEMTQAVEGNGRLIARFGTEESDDDDLVVVDENSGVLNIAWYIYEIIALAIPIKHVHAPGKCNRAMMEMLSEHSATRSSGGVEEKPVDPRWSALQNLKIED